MFLNPSAPLKTLLYCSESFKTSPYHSRISFTFQSHHKPFRLYHDLTGLYKVSGPFYSFQHDSAHLKSFLEQSKTFQELVRISKPKSASLSFGSFWWALTTFQDLLRPFRTIQAFQDNSRPFKTIQELSSRFKTFQNVSYPPLSLLNFHYLSKHFKTFEDLSIPFRTFQDHSGASQSFQDL